jgi:signal transduction histidine kinase
MENFELDPHLRRIAMDLADRIEKPHQLTFDFRGDDAIIELGADMLKEAVEELVSNAVAAMPQGGEIHLSTWLAAQSDLEQPRNIVISVSDQGIGMDEATLNKAPEPFFTKREVGQGMGLGLSFVDGLARIAFGEMRLRSDIGKGTTVELHLPVSF